MNKPRQGTSLIEVIAVLLIIALVSVAFGVNAVSNVKKSNRDAVVSDLQIYASAISDAYYDLGAPSYDPVTELEGFKSFLTIMQGDYLNLVFDVDTLEVIPNGFRVDITSPTDVYEQQYKCWFITSGAVMKYIMMASGGDNGVIEEAGYQAQNYSDDIVLIVRPKV